MRYIKMYVAFNMSPASGGQWSATSDVTFVPFIPFAKRGCCVLHAKIPINKREIPIPCDYIMKRYNLNRITAEHR